ncbi:MAG TPA: DUF5666 domain-containing protein [Ktedonobacterales bacterium]|nr:DUF5666 domain-containing protein [Ktedonobacterales bacterium]
MFSRLTNKLSGMVIGAVAVLAIVGAGAAMAAQNHVGPFTSSSSAAAKGAAQTESSFEAQGVIQQVNYDQGTTQSGSLVLLLSGNQSTATIRFNAQTEIEANHSGDDEGQGDDDAGQVTLQAGQSAKIEGTLQSDGSILASEIKLDVAVAGTPTKEPEPGEDEKLTGVIQSIDTTGQTFVLAQDSGAGAVTIAFDASTTIEHEDSDAAFAVGSHVRVEVVARADGSLYAKEIKPASDDGSGSGSGNSGPGNGGSGDGGSSSGSSGGGDGGPGH